MAQEYIFTGTAQDKTLIVADGQRVNLQVWNNDASKRYVQIFDANDTDNVTLGTTEPRSVMVLPASGGNTWDGQWGTRVAQGMVIAVTTTRTGAVLATAAADVEARY